MGPSGGGKTSLLNALAGHVPLNSRMELLGSVEVNGRPSQGGSHRQASTGGAAPDHIPQGGT